MDNENVVRVDAGRLRRRLAEYYAGAGKDDPVVIHIDAGGNAPRFERQLVQGASPQTPSPEPTKNSGRQYGGRRLIAVALIAASVGFFVAAFLFRHSAGDIAPSPTVAEPPNRTPERRAWMDKSPASLQAVNLSEQARDLIFPLFEREQVALTLGMFRHAIHKDDTFFGGYAGAAQALAALAVFEPNGPIRTEHLAESGLMARRAEELGATEAWSQSALAWVSLVNGQFDEAYRRSHQAMVLAPEDGNVLDFYVIVMLCLGEFEEARVAGTAVRATASVGIATRGFLGAVNFHLGRYREAVNTFNSSATEGSPISAPTLAYLAAAHQALGDTNEARRHAQDLSENWPHFRADVVLGRLYRDQAQADAVHSQLLLAGWSEPETPYLTKEE